MTNIPPKKANKKVEFVESLISLSGIFRKGKIQKWGLIYE
jgi:hypothetical protein